MFINRHKTKTRLDEAVFWSPSDYAPGIGYESRGEACAVLDELVSELSLRTRLARAGSIKTCKSRVLTGASLVLSGLGGNSFWI